jgi:PKD repeat protein
MFRIKMKTTVIISILLFLTISFTAPALAAGEISGVRTISNMQVSPGDTFNVTVTVTANTDIIGPIIHENVPAGWSITSVRKGGSVYNENISGWAWISDWEAGDSGTIIYSLTVPDDADSGVYTITGHVSSDEYKRIPIIGNSQITVSSGTSNPTVTAGFASNATSGYAPLTVEFTDMSSNATSWQWDFDNDGVIDSTVQNPVHTYTGAGTYTVKLIASGIGGSDTKTLTGYITVSESSGGTSLEAAFTANVTSGKAPLTVRFTDLSAGEVTSRQWDFDNDGVVDSTEKNPVHTYSETGTYAVRLIVSGDGGSDTLTKVSYISVTEEGSYNAYEATSVSLSATIIPAISIEVTPGAINFGTLSAGETSEEKTLSIRNKGATDARITAQVTDVAKDLYVKGLMLDSGKWGSYSKIVDSRTTETAQASLYVPSDYIAIGSMEGKVVFWAEVK